MVDEILLNLLENSEGPAIQAFAPGNIGARSFSRKCEGGIEGNEE